MTRLAVILLLLITTECRADVRLPKILGSHMVLQRESDVTVWGWAEPGEQVTVTCDWLDTVTSVKANEDGQWLVALRTGKAGGPHSITVSADNRITLDDILFGEVWIGSGQSNMEMPLVKVSGAYTGIKDAEQEVAAANHPEIRLFQAGNFSSKESLEDVESGITMYGIPQAKCEWSACTPKTVPTFASTAYFFARELHQQLKVPIGIIDSSWGGTPAEAWTPTAGLEKLGYQAELDQAANLPQKPDQKVPTRLYNGMIHPLRKFHIRGVVWYQGEGNSRRADKYCELFSTMITEWRSAFGYDFPFYYVQISPFNYRGLNSAFLREAQFDTLSVKKTGMAVTMDIGNLTDIHPKNKQEVGRRLALWALAKDYGRDVDYSGPLYKSSVIQDGTVRLIFTHAAGLKTSDGKAPTHFEVAGGDDVFHPASAKIDGNEVVVSSEKVPEPKSVRFAFSNDAMPNVTNAAGLPASSFRTDSVPQTPWSARLEIVAKFQSRRGQFNYDEAKVPQYKLPDPLVATDGSRISTVEDWNSGRRDELMELFRSKVYGRRPEVECSVQFEQTGIREDVFDGAATGRSMKATVRIGERSFSFPFVVFVPNKRREAVPGVVHINNRNFVPLEKAASEDDPFWPARSIIERGYATASFHTSDVDPDRKDGYSDGIRAFFANGQPATDDAWRSLSAWGWAASRVLDHLDSLDEVDGSRVAVVGHSRGGKTSLWAACEDTRFAIAYSNNSGCGGAALSRRAYGETVGRITTSFPHWFCKPFSKFAGREGELPVDQHAVISLIAPRGVYVASADEDLWADPRGEYASLIAAAPVFRLLGKKSIATQQMPALNQPRISGQTGYHVRTGGHGLGNPDWKWFLDFADRLLK